MLLLFKHLGLKLLQALFQLDYPLIGLDGWVFNVNKAFTTMLGNRQVVEEPIIVWDIVFIDGFLFVMEALLAHIMTLKDLIIGLKL